MSRPGPAPKWTTRETDLVLAAMLLDTDASVLHPETLAARQGKLADAVRRMDEIGTVASDIEPLLIAARLYLDNPRLAGGIAAMSEARHAFIAARQPTPPVPDVPAKRAPYFD